MGTITTGVSFDTDLINDIRNTSSELGISVSRFVQIASRREIMLHRKNKIEFFVESLSDKELNILINSIIKGA